MTKQESFKRRVRARMEKTGERYVAARRALIAQADNRRRTWVAEPEFGDEAVRAATGKGWDEWCDILDRRPDPSPDHAAIAAYLADTLGVDPWWSQSVTVGYERITGLRLPYQRPDGTFTAGKSATIDGDADMVRKVLLSDDHRPDLFPGFDTELRSRPGSKSIRISVGPGVANIGLDQRDDGRLKVTVDHRGLARFEDVEQWKFYWAEWLEALDGAGPQSS